MTVDAACLEEQRKLLETIWKCDTAEKQDKICDQFRLVRLFCSAGWLAGCQYRRPHAYAQLFLENYDQNMAAGINSHGHRNSRNSNRSIWGHPLDQRKSLRAIILFFFVRKPIRQHGLGKKTYSGIWEHVIQLVTLAECNENAEVTITAPPPPRHFDVVTKS